MDISVGQCIDSHAVCCCTCAVSRPGIISGHHPPQPLEQTTREAPFLWLHLCTNVLIAMPSTVVSAMHYDPDSATLRIIFRSGMVYDYMDVPPAVYDAMRNAGSKGKYLNRFIKGKYAFEKIKG
ncbi:KTSC domain-containing protein [Chitinophaga agrisoli]|nr:KTSC domain-containing protein [Chitinophaga agrisoli]